MHPYYKDKDGYISLYLGDCREITEWLDADVLVTDPPYGRSWKQGGQPKGRGWADDSNSGIAGDESTAVRDAVLELWGDRPAILFGDLMLPPPKNTKQVLIYQKSRTSGTKGTFAGFRRDAEAIYIVGPWKAGLSGKSSILVSAWDGNSAQREYGHPHAKPEDIMRELIRACPEGTIADPFAGSGTTLSAARSLGRRSIGVEVDETYVGLLNSRLYWSMMTPGIFLDQSLQGDLFSECEIDL